MGPKHFVRSKREPGEVEEGPGVCGRLFLLYLMRDPEFAPLQYLWVHMDSPHKKDAQNHDGIVLTPS